MNSQIAGYVLGAVGGAGLLAGYYGLKRIFDRERPNGERRQGLWFINLAVILIGVSLYFSLFAG
ncbi:MAG: hypothetical protein ABFS30_14560 [Pseudomonadota bacterium]